MNKEDKSQQKGDSLSLEDLRVNWRRVRVPDERIEAAKAEIRRECVGRRSMGIAENLARDYSQYMWLGLLVTVLSVPLRLIGAPLWMCIIYGVFGVIMGGIYRSFALYIRQIDFMTLPVVEALEQATRIRILQKRIMLLGILLGLVVLIPLFKFFYDMPEKDAFWGGVTGGVIGLCIGISKTLKFFRTSRKLLRTIEEMKSEPEA